MRRIARLMAVLSLSIVLWLPAPGGVGSAGAAGLGELATSVGSQFVGPLAERFGVPAESVSSLFQSGLSLDGVVKALLISQSSKTSADKVGSLLASNGNNLGAAAKSLNVEPSAYSEDKVSPIVDSLTGGSGASDAKKALGGLLQAK